MWQFVADTGRMYGLNRSASHDDRMDPEKATRAAARHLRDLYERYGDWYLAIAAYNCGAGNVDRAIERTGHADFWILRERRTLPLETTNYVPIILAMTIMAKNPADYDIDGVVPEEPLDYETIELTAPAHLGLIADLADSTVTELQEMNPGLLKNVAPAGFALHVPRSPDLSARLQAIPAAYRASWRVHRVTAGDSIAAVAKRYGAAQTAIVSVNRLEGDRLPAEGEYLMVPRAYADSMSSANARLASRLAPRAKRTASKTKSLSAKTRAVKRTAKKPVLTASRRRG
jgi:membrane-bound lytic murein transglycosylase D